MLVLYFEIFRQAVKKALGSVSGSCLALVETDVETNLLWV